MVTDRSWIEATLFTEYDYIQVGRGSLNKLKIIHEDYEPPEYTNSKNRIYSDEIPMADLNETRTCCKCRARYKYNHECMR